MFKKILQFFFPNVSNKKKKEVSYGTYFLKVLNGCLDTYTSIDANKELEESLILFTTVQSIKPNIDSYIEFLEMLISNIRSDKIIKREDILGDLIPIRLELFFTDKNGCYLDPNESLKEFQSTVITLCHELVLDRHDGDGVFTHNRNIVSNILKNLDEIGKVFK